MAIINVDDAYILNETGKQVDKVTGLYFKDESTTAAEKAFAQLNIGTAGSNRNLLDNPWFTVRQRGNGPWTTAVYAADRWKNTGANQSTTLTSQGLVIQQVNNGYDGVEQKLPADLSAALVGSALTLSINCLTVSGTYRYRMRFFNGGSLISAKFGNITSAGLYSATMDEVPANTNLIVVDFFTNSGRAGDTITVAAIKLEKGTVSTLANDAPPDYGTELAKCMRYFQRLSGYLSYIGSGYCDDATNAYFLCPLSVPLRSGVTVSLSYSGVYLNSNSIQAVTGLSVLRNPTSYNASGIALKATASGLTAKAPALLQIRDENGYIDLSADL